MSPVIQDIFLFQHAHSLCHHQIKKNTYLPFKDHQKHAMLVDILSRKYFHHTALCADFAETLQLHFLTALVHHLGQDNIPHTLRGANMLYFDTQNAYHIEKEYDNFIQTLDQSEHCLLLAFSRFDIFTGNFSHQQRSQLTSHPKCRILIFTHKNTDYQDRNMMQSFAQPHIEGPSQSDIMLLLKMRRAELENHHHIIIPEELLEYAYSLAERFLSTSDTLEHALLLLDSGAARASVVERLDNNTPTKPAMTVSNLTNVLSGWTQIPASHLQLHKFKYAEFVQGIQQKIFGQDAAITLLGHELQQAQTHLQQYSGPYCSMLFTGPEHCGKQTTAIALATQLFKQPDVLFFAQPATPSTQSIIDLKLQRSTDKACLSLKDLIQKTPYAIIFYDHIDRAPSHILDGLQEILSTGYFQDNNGHQYNFHQTILVLTTTLGTGLLHDIAKSFTPEPESQDMDLFQLVMSEQKHEAHASNHYSPQEIADAVRDTLAASLPVTLTQYLNVVPFLPLNHSSIEKIFRLKLKQLGVALEARYGIELGYAPEIIRYLVSELEKKSGIENRAGDVDTVLKQLYFTVEQAVLSQVDNKNRPHQLILQLNETGETLRCDWLASSAVRQHAT